MPQYCLAPNPNSHSRLRFKQTCAFVEVTIVNQCQLGNNLTQKVMRVDNVEAILMT